MSYKIIRAGESRSFPEAHALIDSADRSANSPVYLGVNAGQSFVRDGANLSDAEFVLIELATECLGAYLDETTTSHDAAQTAKIFGFARFRLGSSEPSNLIELVVPAHPNADALAAARKVFEDAGFVVAVCGDFPGRIVDRLVRPYYNAALRRLDEKLATASDMDMTLRLGLGYPEGPIGLLERTGLEHHYTVTQALYEALGDSAYAPARRATNAFNRAKLLDR
ncbi:3-hydroxyacyl-CoA dehydrogenase family protein [Paraburkholderia fungorum]|uniref:3-hydroxyacyl-CoA dehydrogenase family protein n=1 Tax=Paraburkholderia fungorum TaxID=134537 RepID=UPI0020971647|nr:3-hydroxyacyl-CoA dehydrogenase family protein [Paraburkholderia fungorum]USX06760.1 3-hydroxyacyl-CoA dehydrogenase family protein [Paraburkholderia fungorum]